MKPHEIRNSLVSGAQKGVYEEIAAYCQSPYLLDPILAESVSHLSSRYLETKSPDFLHLIYVFSITRGSKVVAQYLPTDVSYFVKVKEELVQTMKSDTNSDWKSQYVLILWIASLVLVPFDLSLIEPNLYPQLYEIASSFLGCSGIQRDAAATLMARLLMRGDNPAKNTKNVDAFINENFEYINPQRADVRNINLRSLGIVQTLSIILDRSSVEVSSRLIALIGTATELHQIEDSSSSFWYYKFTVLAVNWVKIMGRATLKETELLCEVTIPELMALLDHPATKVRYSAAKYIARIIRKLDSFGNQESSDEIVWAVLQSLRQDNSMESASPAYWNGSLIFLAELIRERKQICLVLPTEAMEVLILQILNYMGLHFIQHPINGQIGANVRDAACYVSWSLFRYIKEEKFPIKLQKILFTSLIMLGCVDSDVSIRRAAAAALQEGFGRFKAPHLPESQYGKMELLGMISYNSVKSIEYCYRSLIPLFCVGKDSTLWTGLFRESQTPNIVDMVIHHGLNNSNVKFRRLAADCLSRITAHSDVCDLIIKLLDNSTLDVSGKMLAIGHISDPGLNYRTSELIKFLDPDPNMSSVLTEASISMLHLVPIVTAANFVENTITSTTAEDEQIINEIRRVGGILKIQSNKEELYRDFLPVIERKLTESHLIVEFLIAINDPENEVCKSLIKRAVLSPNPRSRALVAKTLDLNSHDYDTIAHYLNDYTVDKRGEVGAWVRESMLSRLADLTDSSSYNFTGISLPLVSALWRISAESRVPLNKLAAKVIYNVWSIRIGESYLDLLVNCPAECHVEVSFALANTIGKYDEVGAAALRGLSEYLELPESSWVLLEILSINRSKLSCAISVLRTIQQLLITGYDFKGLSPRVFAIAYNTSLEKRANSTLLNCAIDVLQLYAQRSDKAQQRLESMLHTYKVGFIRQRCADALFELGVQVTGLEETDWTISAEH